MAFDEFQVMSLQGIPGPSQTEAFDRAKVDLIANGCSVTTHTLSLFEQGRRELPRRHDPGRRWSGRSGRSV